jgi:hypothetical protein
MRLIGYLWACVPFAGSRPSWLWEGATVAAAAVTPVLAGVRPDTIADWQLWGLWFLCAFILFRIVLVAPYLAWAKLAVENEAMQSLLGNSEARKQLINYISEMTVLDGHEVAFNDLCTKATALRSQFAHEEIPERLEAYFGMFHDHANFDDRSLAARNLIVWVKTNAH